MDNTEPTEPLEQARRAVAEGEAQIERQRALITDLKRAEQDTSEARALLETFVKRQVEHLEHLGFIIRRFPTKS